MFVDGAAHWKAVLIYKDKGLVGTFDPCLKVSAMGEVPAHFLALRRGLDHFQPDWSHYYFDRCKNYTKAPQSGFYVLKYMDSLLQDARLSFVGQEVSPDNEYWIVSCFV